MCFCTGPRIGEPMCPCRMKTLGNYQDFKEMTQWKSIPLDQIIQGPPPSLLDEYKRVLDEDL